MESTASPTRPTSGESEKLGRAVGPMICYCTGWEVREPRGRGRNSIPSLRAFGQLDPELGVVRSIMAEYISVAFAMLLKYDTAVA